MGRGYLLLLFVLTGLLSLGGLGPASAAADSGDTLSIQPPTGATEGLPFDVDATGTSSDPNAALVATYKPAGGSCASTPGVDTGTVSAFDTGVGSGQYSTPALAQVTLSAGSYLVCAWLLDGQQVLSATSATITVAALQASVAISAPQQVDTGQGFTVKMTVTLPANVQLIAVADLIRGRAPCTSDPDAEPNTAIQVASGQVSDSTVPSGTVTVTGSRSVPKGGTNRICAWLLAGWTTDSKPPPVSQPVTSTLSVRAPEVYKGHTSHRRPMSIVLAPVQELIVQVSFTATVHCDGRPILPTGAVWDRLLTGRILFGTDTGHPALRIRGGRFTIYLNHVLRLRGTVGASRITGSFRAAGRVSRFTGNHRQHFSCSTGLTRFSVRR